MLKIHEKNNRYFSIFIYICIESERVCTVTDKLQMRNINMNCPKKSKVDLVDGTRCKCWTLFFLCFVFFIALFLCYFGCCSFFLPGKMCKEYVLHFFFLFFSCCCVIDLYFTVMMKRLFVFFYEISFEKKNI